MRTSVIDTDGQVSPTKWRSGATWIWSQNHLLLQTAIEIPSHIAATLPPSLSNFVRGSTYKGPFKLQDDHRFLILELHGPSELFNLGKQSLRVTAEYDHTNWMRNANCRESNVSLAEVEDTKPSEPGAFFISLFCRPAKGGTWIEISSSDEVSLSFEPHGQIRFSSLPEGTQFWLPRGPHPRVLSDVIVADGGGEVVSRYELSADPVVVERIPMRTASGAEPIYFSIDGSSTTKIPAEKLTRPIFGLNAQVLDAHGSLDSRRTGVASTEIAVSARGDREFSWGTLAADLEIPIRRLGAGLNANGAGSHFGYLNMGYAVQTSDEHIWVIGAEASVLDVHSPSRTSVASIAPSVTARIGSRYSMTIAPFDLVSSFSIARARVDWPVTSDQKNRLTFEALLGRTWIQPQDDSWNVNGVSMGFVGEF